MTEEELLLSLRDIQPPLEPAWWYLSPATIGLIGFVVVGTVVLWLVYRQRRMDRLFDRASCELERIVAEHEDAGDDREFALDLALWLKRVALIAFPDRQLESASGRRWLEFLDQSMGDTRFTRGGGCIFGGAVYRERLYVDATETVDICRQWLTSIKPQLRKRYRGRC